MNNAARKVLAREPTEAMIAAAESAASVGIGKSVDDQAIPRVLIAAWDAAPAVEIPEKAELHSPSTMSPAQADVEALVHTVVGHLSVSRYRGMENFDFDYTGDLPEGQYELVLRDSVAASAIYVQATHIESLERDLETQAARIAELERQLAEAQQQSLQFVDRQQAATLVVQELMAVIVGMYVMGADGEHNGKPFGDIVSELRAATSAADVVAALRSRGATGDSGREAG